MTEPPAASSAERGAPHYRMVIDGHRIEAGSGRRFDTVDPFLGAAWATAADGDAGDVDLAVAAARQALSGPWGKLTGFGRARLMRRLGDIIARDTGGTRRHCCCAEA
jgi:acyl-CoA reductase-like NAD-dependent aldehyde dehydrogenase